MSRGLLLGAGIIGGGALLAYALRERPSAGVPPVDYEFAPEVVKHSPNWQPSKGMMTNLPTMLEVVKKGLATVTDAAKAVWKSLKLPSEAQQNIVKYRISELIDKYRGGIPKAFVLGIMHTETGGTFNPLIYNYPYKSGRGGVAYAAAGAGTYGDGWFKYNPHAIGLFQILQGYKKDYSRYGGFDHELSIRELLDAENNVRAGLGALKIHWQKRITKVPQASDADKLAMLYFCHNQGGGYLDKGLAATKNGLSARDVIKAVGAGMAGAPLTVALATASRGGMWAQLGDLKDVLA
jgi:hypothetical protein